MVIRRNCCSFWKDEQRIHKDKRKLTEGSTERLTFYQSFGKLRNIISWSNFWQIKWVSGITSFTIIQLHLQKPSKILLRKYDFKIFEFWHWRGWLEDGGWHVQSVNIWRRLTTWYLAKYIITPEILGTICKWTLRSSFVLLSGWNNPILDLVLALGSALGSNILDKFGQQELL